MSRGDLSRSCSGPNNPRAYPRLHGEHTVSSRARKNLLDYLVDLLESIRGDRINEVRRVINGYGTIPINQHIGHMVSVNKTLMSFAFLSLLVTMDNL